MLFWGQRRTISCGHRRQSRRRRPLWVVARDKSGPCRGLLQALLQPWLPVAAWWELDVAKTVLLFSNDLYAAHRDFPPISMPRSRSHWHVSPGHPGAYLMVHSLRAPLRTLPSMHHICWRCSRAAVPASMPTSGPTPTSTPTPTPRILLRNGSRRARYPVTKIKSSFENDWRTRSVSFRSNTRIRARNACFETRRELPYDLPTCKSLRLDKTRRRDRSSREGAANLIGILLLKNNL